MKTLTLVALLVVSMNASALRCGNVIIDTGTSEREVVSNCQVDDTYVVNNQNADIKKVYNEQGGMTNEIVIVDGKVQEINSNRQ